MGNLISSFKPIFMLGYLGVFLWSAITFAQLIQDSQLWRPVMGVVKYNTVEKRTIAYRVGNLDYLTDNESMLDVFGEPIGLEFNMRPGQSKTLINGVDPEIGRQVQIYYNPNQPSQAVVLKGMSLPVGIYLICSLIPFGILMIFPEAQTNNMDY